MLVGIALTIALVVFVNNRAPGGLVEWTMNYIAGLGNGDGYPVKASDTIKNGIIG